jgi:hypothetical protein
MTTIQTTASVTPDHRLIVDTNAPAEIPPGEHRVVVMIAPQPAVQTANELLFQPYPVGPVSEDITFGREQIYGDDGR